MIKFNSKSHDTIIGEHTSITRSNEELEKLVICTKDTCSSESIIKHINLTIYEGKEHTTAPRHLRKVPHTLVRTNEHTCGYFPFVNWSLNFQRTIGRNII